MKLSIIIPCWILNDEIWNLTLNTYESLMDTEDLTDYELIIIDNGSPLRGDWLTKMADVVIRNKENLGFPKAVNQGIKLSKGELLVIANNDIRVSPNWLRVTNEILETYPKAGTVHFRMIPYNEPATIGKNAWLEGKERWCTGSFYVAKRQIFVDAGLYDENYGLGGYDDYDLFKRVRKVGYKQVYTNGAFFQHQDSATQLLRDPKERAESDKKNREYYKKKYGEYPDVEFAKTFPEQMKEPWRPFP